MSTAAASPSLPRSASGMSRRQQSYSTPQEARPTRSPSTTSRSTANATAGTAATPSSPTQRPPSQSQAQASTASHQRTSSSSHQTNLTHVAQRDYETTNVAKTPTSAGPSGARRSMSHDRTTAPPVSIDNATRSSAQRHRSTSRGAQGRYHTTGDTGAASEITSAEKSTSDNRNSIAVVPRKRTEIEGLATGTWTLGKTIGQGSMGKVKLAKNVQTGEQAAVKIVPRQATDKQHATQAEQERADHSKEIRTAREAAIVTLVNHPFICGMRDVKKTNYHWYMLFEYVNGGQMLDYIISHGRLKEKQARKFARQIVSALDYCHRNSIVHRDLKIENILISKTGDIKIIDFGLSNLFAPASQLKTFCGSLYFAAPELLQAKKYQGPEVDVWSFGIVLYVLVCGKVPFDDQSMPQLHNKIKRGLVDYPNYLSTECKSLINRMLQTNPQNRATLQEIMCHPWMTKGYGGPPENYLPNRKPIQLPLDPEVLQKMGGFDFGRPDRIEEHLTRIIKDSRYQLACQMSDQRQAAQTSDVDRKRSVFEFYRRRNSISSRDTLVGSSEELNLGSDPINAYHPLLSIYYLASEKIERERAEANPGGLEIPDTTNNVPILEDLPAPQTALTNSHSYEMAGEQATGGRSRPRARTHGEDEVTEGLANTGLKPPTQQDSRQATTPTSPGATSSEPQQPQRSGTVGGLLRRLSRRERPAERELRDREKVQERPTGATLAPPATDRPASRTEESGTDQPFNSPRKSFSVRKPRRDHPPISMQNRTYSGSASQVPSAPLATPGAQPPHSARESGRPESMVLPSTGDSHSGGGLLGRSRSHRLRGLARSTSVNSGDFRRRLAKRSHSDVPSTNVASDERGALTEGSDAEGSSLDARRKDGAATDTEGATTPRKPAPANRARSLGHARHESIQARRRMRAGAEGLVEERPSAEEEAVEKTDFAGRYAGSGQGMNTSGHGIESPVGSGDIKPIYLKGLFSVSTTSSKPLTFIRADLIRVLTSLGVEFHEIKGGFACRHGPSIIPKNSNRATVAMDSMRSPGLSSSPGMSNSHRRRISFQGILGLNGAPTPDTPRFFRRDRSYPNTDDDEAAFSEDDDNSVTASKRRTVHNPPTSATPAVPEVVVEDDPAGTPPGHVRPRHPGETTTHVRDDLGEAGNLALRFEIVVVKVPIINLHGIQFKKVDGGTWQYKNMASTILNDLRL